MKSRKYIARIFVGLVVATTAFAASCRRSSTPASGAAATAPASQAQPADQQNQANVSGYVGTDDGSDFKSASQPVQIAGTNLLLADNSVTAVLVAVKSGSVVTTPVTGTITVDPTTMRFHFTVPVDICGYVVLTVGNRRAVALVAPNADAAVVITQFTEVATQLFDLVSADPAALQLLETCTDDLGAAQRIAFAVVGADQQGAATLLDAPGLLAVVEPKDVARNLGAVAALQGSGLTNAQIRDAMLSKALTGKALDAGISNYVPLKFAIDGSLAVALPEDGFDNDVAAEALGDAASTNAEAAAAAVSDLINTILAANPGTVSASTATTVAQTTVKAALAAANPGDSLGKLLTTEAAAVPPSTPNTPPTTGGTGSSTPTGATTTVDPNALIAKINQQELNTTYVTPPPVTIINTDPCSVGTTLDGTTCPEETGTVTPTATEVNTTPTLTATGCMALATGCVPTVTPTATGVDTSMPTASNTGMGTMTAPGMMGMGTSSPP